ncbi:transcriptional regulator [Variovorax paradoxus]|jgi:LysR family transcriptional regulator for bpeEF and oprC|uniref:LysR family transcriptional regulator n=3 Tax=Variovorax paradoxus TaxID=34073 RepID=UPI0006E57642|nr:transcriptional regulator [Variovorax paradoxus]KPV12467.1 transcriptional regulator [Variovorax paradoxus]KPV12769.1 transcriptional regulator [Variovorax paradoxus]KPV38046.1 transcriptional regulator [Variovorax paradoxus]
MDRLQSMQIFARVVEMHSFTRAADSLVLPKSRVTRAVKDLEKLLGARLLQRTTRHISLTPEGTLYYDHCRRLLAEIEAVESSFPGSAGRPRGRLRVDMTLSLARLVVLPSIRDFQSRYPDVELTLTVSDRTVELVQEGIDCVIRAGTPEDSATLVARRIGAFDWVSCASPEYLERHGTPKTLEDLARHKAVGYLSSRTARSLEWHFVENGEDRCIAMRESLIVNDTDAYVACGLEGLGLIRAGSYMVQQHLRSGQLRRVLADYAAPAAPLSVLYPQNRHLSPTVRAFVDWVGGVVGKAEAGWRVDAHLAP